MNNWGIHCIQYLSKKSIESINTGQTPLTPKYNLTFVEKNTGLLSTTSDLDLKKRKRLCSFVAFRDTYSRLYKKNRVSILTIVVNDADYPKIGKFINTITRKLKRKGIERLGYIWVRDIGDIKFEKHYHVLIATSPITKELFFEMFHKKKHSNYEVQFVRSTNGITRYLTDKELFAAKRQRAYQASRKFKNPKNSIVKCI